MAAEAIEEAAYRKNDPADLINIALERLVEGSYELPAFRTLNDIIELSDKTAKEVERLSRVVGKEGKIMHRASVPAASGSWLRLVDSTNLLIDDMARPTSEMARVIGEGAGAKRHQVGRRTD